MKHPKLFVLGASSTALAAILAGGVVSAGASSNPISTFTTSVGLTQAQADGDDRDAARETYLQDLADNLGVSLDTLKAALSQTSLDELDRAVTDGKITSSEADAIREKIESGGGPFWGFGGFGGGFAGGFGDHHGDGPGGFVRGVDTAEIAEFLGIDEDTLRSELEAGSSLATIAEEHGKTRDELKAFLTNALTTALNARVASGEITQEEADARLAEATENLDARIDATFSGTFNGTPMGHGRGPGGHGGWPGAPADSDDGSDSGSDSGSDDAGQ